jgi:hypothetical protein
MKTLKRIGLGIGGLIIVAAIACGGSSADEEAPSATVVEETAEPDVIDQIVNRNEERREAVVIRLTSWNLQRSQSECFASKMDREGKLDDVITILVADQEDDRFPGWILMHPFWMECGN